MPSSAQHLFSAALLLLFAQRAATAHSSLESTASIWVRSTGIEVQLYMSRASAAVLLEKDGEHITIVRDNFPTFERRLAANGPTLLALTASDGAALQADAAAASLTDEDDICYNLHYPLPGVLPGPLRIRTTYLHKLDEGHLVNIYVLNAANDQLGQGDISAETPDFEVHLPALVGVTPKSPPAAATAPSIGESTQGSRWGLWAMLGGSALVIAIVAVRGIAVQNAARKTNP